MGRIYKRGRTWWAEYRAPTGERYRASLATRDKAVAQQRLRQLELVGPADRAQDGPTLGQAMTHLLDTVYAGRAVGTVTCYRQKARHLVRLLDKDRPIRSIERADLHQYRAIRLGEGASDGSVHKELVVLRRALSEQGIEGVVPRVSANYRPRDRALTPDVFAAVVECLAVKRRLWLMVACYLGVRDSELNGLRWEDVHLDRGQVRVRGTKTPAAFRLLPIPTALLPWLEINHAGTGPVVAPWTNRRRDICLAWWRANGEPLPKRVRGQRSRVESVAGRSRISPNDLRRTFASWMKQAGVDSLAVAHLLGHSSTRMVERVYGQLNEATYRAAVATLPDCAVFVRHAGASEAPQAREAQANEGDNHGTSVPRGGVEPPTRGFSGPVFTVLRGGKDKGNGK